MFTIQQLTSVIRSDAMGLGVTAVNAIVESVPNPTHDLVSLVRFMREAATALRRRRKPNGQAREAIRLLNAVLPADSIASYAARAIMKAWKKPSRQPSVPAGRTFEYYLVQVFDRCFKTLPRDVADQLRERLRRDYAICVRRAALRPRPNADDDDNRHAAVGLANGGGEDFNAKVRRLTREYLKLTPDQRMQMIDELLTRSNGDFGRCMTIMIDGFIGEVAFHHVHKTDYPPETNEQIATAKRNACLGYKNEYVATRLQNYVDDSVDLLEPTALLFAFLGFLREGNRRLHPEQNDTCLQRLQTVIHAFTDYPHQKNAEPIGRGLYVGTRI